ncbi:uncharacterized protein LOC114801233 [Denticeps clupeoides]|uniref:uncharacterized protein LOC114801233 n=1 Tax=Denticeps clupeoides TaxID=299321 RepID=UPI0010A4189D|nr:uncharacterized protein LOC114801233 [Denticeps clupeoides]
MQFKCRAHILQPNLQKRSQGVISPGLKTTPSTSKMAGNCSKSHTVIFEKLCGSFELWVLVAVVTSLLVLSLCWNILCCVGNRCADKGKVFLPLFRRSISLKRREMEDNPIYGNITYTQSTELVRHPTIPHDPKRAKSTVKKLSNARDCYANLTLKVPKPESGRGSPVAQIQYSDVVSVPREQDVDTTTDIADNTSLLSDLYASVDNKLKTTALDSTEDYANHF